MLEPVDNVLCKGRYYYTIIKGEATQSISMKAVLRFRDVAE